MEISPTFSPNPHRRTDAEHQPLADCPTARLQHDTSEILLSPGKSIAEMNADSAKANARRVAEEIIYQRKQSGFYHRSEIVSTVALRLMESGDLDQINSFAH